MRPTAAPTILHAPANPRRLVEEINDYKAYILKLFQSNTPTHSYIYTCTLCLLLQYVVVVFSRKCN